MKKILLFIISFLVLSPVKADVTTCDNYLVTTSIEFYKPSGSNYTFFYFDNNSIGIPYASGWFNGYVKFFPTNTLTDVSTSNLSFQGINPNNTNAQGPPVGSSVSWNNTSNIFSATISPTSIAPNEFRIGFYYSNAAWPSSSANLYLTGTPVLFSTNLSDIENCTLAPEEPDPPTPSPNIFSSFISLYTNRLGFLGSNFISNDILFTFIVIIFAFIILDFVISLLKGGKRK